MGRDHLFRSHRCQLRCFNPRARMGRDHRGHRAQRHERVSIHAPAWGATELDHQLKNKWGVSIHAPAWGATYIRGVWANGRLFQSTRPHGARQLQRLPVSRSQRFNPRARMGRDKSVSMMCLAVQRFNPRARMGRDLTSCIYTYKKVVSIHAPAWGATYPL